MTIVDAPARRRGTDLLEAATRDRRDEVRRQAALALDRIRA